MTDTKRLHTVRTNRWNVPGLSYSERRHESVKYLWGTEGDAVNYALEAAWLEGMYADIRISRPGSRAAHLGVVSGVSTEDGPPSITYTRWADGITATLTRTTPTARPQITGLYAELREVLTLSPGSIIEDTARAIAEQFAVAGSFRTRRSGTDFHFSDLNMDNMPIEVFVNHAPGSTYAYLHVTATMTKADVDSAVAAKMQPAVQRIADAILQDPAVESHTSGASRPDRTPDRRAGNEPTIVDLIRNWLAYREVAGIDLA